MGTNNKRITNKEWKELKLEDHTKDIFMEDKEWEEIKIINKGIELLECNKVFEIVPGTPIYESLMKLSKEEIITLLNTDTDDN